MSVRFNRGPGVIGMPGFVGYRVAMFMDSSEAVGESAWPLSINILTLCKMIYL